MNFLLLGVNNGIKLNKLKLKLVRFASTAIAQLNVCSYSDDEPSNTSFNTTLHVRCTPSKVVHILESLRREPNIAFSFFCELEERGFHHNISTYAALIRILCSWGLERKLESLFLNLIGSKKMKFDVLDLLESLDQGCVVDGSFIRAYDALIKAYVSVSLYDNVVDLLFRSQRKGFVPHIFTCNYLLDRLINNGKMSMALVVYKQLKRFGCQPNDKTYATVIKALCKIGNMEEAIDILEEMSESGVVPNALVCAAYIEGLCTHDCSTSGYQLLQAWRAEQFPIDTYAYFVVIYGFCKEMKIDEAENVFLDMGKYGVVPDAQTYGVLINGYCKKLNLQKALSLHSLMLSKGIKSNGMIVSSILQCLLRMQMYSEVVNQFKEFQCQGVFLDKVVYNIVVHALCELGKLEEAIELLEDMTSRHIQMDVVHYTTMIKGFFVQGKIHEAMIMFENLKKNGVEPDTITYNVLAAGLSRNGLVSKVQGLLDYMEEHGLRDPKMPDLVIENLCIGGKVKEATEFFNNLEAKTIDNYSAMINGYCAANHTKAAYELFVNLSKKGDFIKRSSLVRLVRSLCMEDSCVRAIAVIKQVTIMNVEANEIVYNEVIASLCRARNMKMARYLFDCLVCAGLTPDLITYTMMINGYCKINFLREAYELLCDMKNRGREPDIFIYTVLLDGQFKTRVRERCSSVGIALTSTVFDEMKDMKITPDVVFYTVVIDGFCKMNNLNDAVVLFEEMIDQGIEPDEVSYTALLSGCCRSGDTEKARTLCNDMMSKGILPPKNFSYLLHHDTLKNQNNATLQALN